MVRLESWSKFAKFLLKNKYPTGTTVLVAMSPFLSQQEGRKNKCWGGGDYKDFWRANKDVTVEKAGWNENDFHRQGNRLENRTGQLQVSCTLSQTMVHQMP